MLETSKQIEALPATADALRAGKLSAAKAEAIASAATVAPDAEAELLATAADAPLAVVREQCLRAKAVDRDAAHARIKKGRYAKEFTDDEGGWNFIARGTPEAGAKFRAAHGPIVDEMFKTARAEDRKESRDAYAFDALIELAERTRGERTAKKTAPGFTALIRADIEALQRGTRSARSPASDPSPPPSPATSSATRSSSSSSPKASTSPTSRISAAAPQSRRRSRSGGNHPCAPTKTAREPSGCRTTIGSDGPKTHRTRLDELDRLCEHDHDLKTYYGWALIAGQGRRPFVPPDDPRHPKYRAPPDP